MKRWPWMASENHCWPSSTKHKCHNGIHSLGRSGHSAVWKAVKISTLMMATSALIVWRVQGSTRRPVCSDVSLRGWVLWAVILRPQYLFPHRVVMFPQQVSGHISAETWPSFTCSLCQTTNKQPDSHTHTHPHAYRVTNFRGNSIRKKIWRKIHTKN